MTRCSMTGNSNLNPYNPKDAKIIAAAAAKDPEYQVALKFPPTQLHHPGHVKFLNAFDPKVSAKIKAEMDKDPEY